jgi:hypothetical protein
MSSVNLPFLRLIVPVSYRESLPTIDNLDVLGRMADYILNFIGTTFFVLRDGVVDLENSIFVPLGVTFIDLFILPSPLSKSFQ